MSHAGIRCPGPVISGRREIEMILALSLLSGDKIEITREPI